MIDLAKVFRSSTMESWISSLCRGFRANLGPSGCSHQARKTRNLGARGQRSFARPFAWAPRRRGDAAARRTLPRQRAHIARGAGDGLL